MSNGHRIQQYKGTATKRELHQLPHPWMAITPPIYSHVWCEFQKKLVCRSKLLFLNCTYALFWQSLDISKQDVSSRTVINQIGTTSFFAQHILTRSLHSILTAAVDLDGEGKTLELVAAYFVFGRLSIFHWELVVALLLMPPLLTNNNSDILWDKIFLWQVSNC